MSKKQYKPRKRESHSSVEKWNTCHQLYDYIYNKKVRSMFTTVPLLVGEAFHEGVDVWYKTGKKKKALKAASKYVQKKLDKLSRYIDPAEAQGLVKQEVVIEGMLKGYFKQYRKDLNIYEILMSERWVKGRGYTGKLDTMFQHKKKNKIIIVDHKSVGKIDQNSVDMRVQSGQLEELVILGDLDPIPTHAMYNFIRRPAIRQKKDQDYQQYLDELSHLYTDHSELYLHREVYKLDTEVLEEARDTFKDHCKDIKHAVRTGRFSKNFKSCSMQYGYPCIMRPVCRGGKSFDDPALKGMFNV